MGSNRNMPGPRFCLLSKVEAKWFAIGRRKHKNRKEAQYFYSGTIWYFPASVFMIPHNMNIATFIVGVLTGASASLILGFLYFAGRAVSFTHGKWDHD